MGTRRVRPTAALPPPPPPTSPQINAFGVVDEAAGPFSQPLRKAEAGLGQTPPRALWLREALFNHSDTPNAVTYQIGEFLFTFAAKPVAAGEELCISYAAGPVSFRDMSGRYSQWAGPRYGGFVSQSPRAELYRDRPELADIEKEVWPSPRAASEGKGPQRPPQRRLGRRLEEVAEAVGGGYCRLQMPLRLALGVRGTVAGHRLGAVAGGRGVPPPIPMHPCPPPLPKAYLESLPSLCPPLPPLLFGSWGSPTAARQPHRSPPRACTHSAWAARCLCPCRTPLAHAPDGPSAWGCSVVPHASPSGAPRGVTVVCGVWGVLSPPPPPPSLAQQLSVSCGGVGGGAHNPPPPRTRISLWEKNEILQKEM